MPTRFPRRFPCWGRTIESSPECTFAPRRTDGAAPHRMASNLTDRLSRVVKTMRGQARITEDNVQDMLREVRMALLEADVALPVVRDFVARVKDQALGAEVAGSLSPGQALVGIVNRELAAVMGEGESVSRPGHAATGGHPDGRPAGSRQDDDHREACEVPDREAPQEGADRFGRRLSTGRDRAVEDGHTPIGRRVVSVDGFRCAPRHRPGGARLRPQALLRCAARRYRRPARHRRKADGRDRQRCMPRCGPSRPCSSSTRCRARTPSTPRKPSRRRCP